MQVLTQDWLAQNQFRRYPLSGGATLLDTTGTFELPNDLLVDARIAAPAEYYSAAGVGRPYIQSVTATSSAVTVTFVAGAAILTATAARSASMVTAPLLTPTGEVRGHVTFGRTDTAAASLFGTRLFTAESAPVLPTLLVPYATGVTSITVVSEGGNASKKLTGDVVVKAGTNILAAGSSGTIHLGAEIQAGEVDPCECEEAGSTARAPILTLNNVEPDENGNIDLTNGGCLKITPKTAEIELEDTCSKPCISASDMAAINALVAALTAQQAGLGAAAAELMNRVNNLLLPLLSSGTNLADV